MNTKRPHLIALILLSTLLALPADAQVDIEASPMEFLPLEVGNQWTYEHHYSNEALYEYHLSFRIYTEPYWAEPSSPMRDVVQALFGLPGYPWYPDEQGDFRSYDRDAIEAYKSPLGRELTLEITHTEIIEGHEYFVFSLVPYDWPPVPNFFLAGQKVRFSDEGALLIRWDGQDIPFYAFHAEEPYRLPAYPVLHNENLPIEHTIAPFRYPAGVEGNSISSLNSISPLVDITPPLSLGQTTAAGFFILWDQGHDFLWLGSIDFILGYGLVAYSRMEAATGNLGFIFPAFDNTIVPISAVIGGQKLEFSYTPVEWTNVQSTTWGQLKARHRPRP